MPLPVIGISYHHDPHFWVQFARIWRHLADISAKAQRSEYLAKAQKCLERADAIRAELACQTANNDD